MNSEIVLRPDVVIGNFSKPYTLGAPGQSFVDYCFESNGQLYRVAIPWMALQIERGLEVSPP